MNIAIARTKYPNIFFKLLLFILLASDIPTKIQIIANPENLNSNCQSISNPPSASPSKKPINDWAEIIVSDVPTAFFISNFPKKTSDGIIRNPPPAPANPAIKPVKMPLINNEILFAAFPSDCFLPFIIEYEEYRKEIPQTMHGEYPFQQNDRWERHAY